MHPIEGTVLGKQVSHPKEYAPEILVAVPRILNRMDYGIKNEHLPFTGIDVWHAYELSFLTNKGLPITGVLKIAYSCKSEFLVESKSLKLYLNSFNMGQYGNNRHEAIQEILMLIEKDLESLLKTKVTLGFHENKSKQNYDFNDYTLLENLNEAQEVEFKDFTETPNLLKLDTNPRQKEFKFQTQLLRSNCKITQQPDWGNAFIHIKSQNAIDPISLLKYIVSIRDENHFHEEICELLYLRLWEKLHPEILSVSCLYTRRGGIDICPTRSNKEEYLPKHITNANTFSTPSFRQ